MTEKYDVIDHEDRPDIRPRNISFFLPADLPRHWHSNDPYITAFFNGLSVMFPEGERFFVDSVRHFQSQITDPKLKDEVRAFCGQEGIHAREHRRYNDVLAAQGYPVRKLERFIERGIAMDRKMSAKYQLAITCALEHFTAMFAEIVLRESRCFAEAHPAMRKLWTWHALEESEHKAVAYDVYQTIAPGFVGYLRRIVAMALTTVLFLMHIVVHQSVLVRHDGVFWSLQARKSFFRYLWRTPGFMRLGLRHYFRYYRRDFHPWQQDSKHLVARWKTEYAVEAS
jgi:predicted metal-dependent hydrolase